jgi:hypothetical protein
LIGKDIDDFGKGMLIDGPVGLAKGVVNQVIHGNPVVATADLVKVLHTAASNPGGAHGSVPGR